MKTKLIAPIGILAVSLLGLAGCAAAGAPKPTPTGTAAPVVEVEKKAIACENGVAKVTENNIEATIAGDCAKVELAASNSIVKVGAVGTLSIDGAINRVVAGSIDRLTITGNGNTVVAPNEVNVTDNGDQNEVVKEDPAA